MLTPYKPMYKLYRNTQDAQIYPPYTETHNQKGTPIWYMYILRFMDTLGPGC